MNCTHCSAKIASDALTCPYCGHETPNLAKARALADEQARHAQQLALIEASTARQLSLASLESGAKTAFYWSLGGVVACCLPFGSVVALFLGTRVRKNAAALGVPTPWQSIAAIAISSIWIMLYVLFAVFVVVLEHEKSARIGVLREATQATAARPELDADTACALVELTLLEGGAGESGGSLEVFRCAGAVEKTSAIKAVIKDLEFARSSNDTPQRVDGCLSRGSRWKVDAIGTGFACGSGRDAGE